MNEQELQELRQWTNDVSFPGNPDLSIGIRIRAASTYRSIREASRRGDVEQAEEWLDALQDYREIINRVVALAASDVSDTGLPRGTTMRLLDELGPVVARMPPFNAQEAAAAQQATNRVFRRIGVAPPRVPSVQTAGASSGFVWVAVGVGVLWMLSRRRG